jgi:large exoprotein involved in heme utilization and adhesion
LVDASRSIELTGVNEIRLAPSGIGATAFDSGNAGDLTVNTSRLRILQGATVNTSAVASGSAGNVTINASDAVEVSGRIPNSLTFSTVSSSAPLVDPLVQQIFNLPPVPSGTSGNVTINTRRLTVTNGGQVSVRNDGTGNAGTLFVNAPQIFLNSGGSITAATAAGNGGEIAIDSSDLRLADGASIAATAGSNGNQCLPQRTLSILGFHSRHRW